MARRPRNQPISRQSTEITDKEVVRYDGHNKRLKMRIQIDGIDYIQVARKVLSADPAEHQRILDTEALNAQEHVKNAKTDASIEAIRAGVGDWAALEEGPEKRDIAQQAMRDVVDFAREGKRLQSRGRTRPQAFERYAQTRNLKANIWDELDYIGNHVAKADYLALSGPGDGTEYGELRKYMNDLEKDAPSWNAIVNFMATCTNPIKIDSDKTV